MSRTSVSHFGISENPNLVHLNLARVKPMTLTLMLATSQAGVRHCWDRTRTGWFSVRKTWLSEISGHGACGLISKLGSTIKSP